LECLQWTTAAAAADTAGKAGIAGVKGLLVTQLLADNAVPKQRLWNACSGQQQQHQQQAKQVSKDQSNAATGKAGVTGLLGTHLLADNAVAKTRLGDACSGQQQQWRRQQQQRYWWQYCSGAGTGGVSVWKFQQHQQRRGCSSRTAAAAAHYITLKDSGNMEDATAV
jgi:hypothetical protein